MGTRRRDKSNVFIIEACLKSVTHNYAYLGVSNGKCETSRDGETDTFSASPRLP